MYFNIWEHLNRTQFVCLAGIRPQVFEGAGERPDGDGEGPDLAPAQRVQGHVGQRAREEGQAGPAAARRRHAADGE